ncbi:hypothetical protein HYU17_01495 [Candidatus Woesearchaeota archaeon]|nr:hypothetical protein [Candidatus Woesearchaeota archaeon]
MLAAQFYNTANGKYDVLLEKGTVVPLETVTGLLVVREGLVPVRGMIPFGGSSGAPVIDQKGRVIGVESGAYANTAKKAGEVQREDYTGASLGPVTAIRELARNCAEIISH